MDSINRKILRELQRNGRIAITDLAEKVGLSSTPCGRRVKELERAGVIRGYTCILDHSKLGYGIEALVHVTLEKHADFTINNFVNSVRSIPQITLCLSLTGQYDALLRIVARDLASYEKLLMQELAKIPGVANFTSSLVLNRLVDRRELIPQ